MLNFNGKSPPFLYCHLRLIILANSYNYSTQFFLDREIHFCEKFKYPLLTLLSFTLDYNKKKHKITFPIKFLQETYFLRFSKLHSRGNVFR